MRRLLWDYLDWACQNITSITFWPHKKTQIVGSWRPYKTKKQKGHYIYFYYIIFFIDWWVLIVNFNQVEQQNNDQPSRWLLARGALDQSSDWLLTHLTALIKRVNRYETRLLTLELWFLSPLSSRKDAWENKNTMFYWAF